MIEGKYGLVALMVLGGAMDILREFEKLVFQAGRKCRDHDANDVGGHTIFE